ncbi:MAG: hypothetical protein ACKVJA_06790, partial [Flavobacteriales bacterium]
PIPHQLDHIPDNNKYKKILFTEYRDHILIRTDTDPLKAGQCSIWEGSCVSEHMKGNQHGIFSFRGKTVRAHVLMYHNFVASLPNDFGRRRGKDIPAVCHTCDSNGRCINIHHLYMGTISTNTRDKYRHGNGPQQKLSIEDVKNIKSSFEDLETISKKYNMTKGTINKILKGKNWGWV